MGLLEEQALKRGLTANSNREKAQDRFAQLGWRIEQNILRSEKISLPVTTLLPCPAVQSNRHHHHWQHLDLIAVISHPSEHLKPVHDGHFQIQKDDVGKRKLRTVVEPSRAFQIGNGFLAVWRRDAVAARLAIV